MHHIFSNAVILYLYVCYSGSQSSFHSRYLYQHRQCICFVHSCHSDNISDNICNRALSLSLSSFHSPKISKDIFRKIRWGMRKKITKKNTKDEYYDWRMKLFKNKERNFKAFLRLCTWVLKSAWKKRRGHKRWNKSKRCRSLYLFYWFDDKINYTINLKLLGDVA